MTRDDFLELINKHHHIPYFEIDDLDNPRFDLNIGKVHNWRNYVPDIAKAIWDELSFETKFIIYIMAEQQADREEWD